MDYSHSGMFSSRHRKYEQRQHKFMVISNGIQHHFPFHLQNYTFYSSPKNFFSQENLIKDLHIPALISTSHSWENLQTSKNWLVNDNGRILLELNYMNSSRHAKIPIAQNTAKLLQNCTDDHISDLIHTTKKIKLISNDENHNNIVHQSQ